MTLAKWMKKADRTDESLARAVGCHRSTITRIRSKERTANAGLALAIELETGGEVQAEELPLSDRARGALRMFRQAELRLRASA
jgi:hypothetical protein